MQAIQEVKNEKPKEVKLGFVEDKKPVVVKKRDLKASYKHVTSRLTQPIVAKKVLTTEEAELQQIKSRGSFKARPLKRSVLAPRVDRDDCLSTLSRVTEFKEFNLRTSQLPAKRPAPTDLMQAPTPFKARELDKKILEPRLSLPVQASKPLVKKNCDFKY